jgi:hypothetical protein
LFPVLTSFRSILPLQRIWDHGLQRGLPSKRGLVNRGPIPRRIPKRLHAQTGLAIGKQSTPFPTAQAVLTKERPPDVNEPRRRKVGDSPSPFPSQASTPRQTGTSMARTRTGQPTLFHLTRQPLKCTGAKALSSLKSQQQTSHTPQSIKGPPTGQQSLPIVSKTVGLLYREPKGSHLSASGPVHFLAISPMIIRIAASDPSGSY